jgi:hypothetical protein
MINMERWGSDGCSATPLRTQAAQPVWSFECHYCAYGPEPDQALPARCPKCGGSAWELTPVPGSLLMCADRAARGWGGLNGGEKQNAGADAVLATVLFRLRVAAAQVYLLLGGDSGALKMIPLHETEREEWETRLHLPPGVYRYRFYVDDGVRLVYVAPSEMTGRHTAGLDGRLLVPSPAQVAEEDCVLDAAATSRCSGAA